MAQYPQNQPIALSEIMTSTNGVIPLTDVFIEKSVGIADKYSDFPLFAFDDASLLPPCHKCIVEEVVQIVITLENIA